MVTARYRSSLLVLTFSMNDFQPNWKELNKEIFKCYYQFLEKKDKTEVKAGQNRNKRKTGQNFT